jgi:NTP pyrophosphatase (non-canonical NTP hydrolase)
MNNLEYLFTTLMEECGELSQSISKCVRFTTNHVCPKKGKPNIEDVRIEFSDVMALLEMLRDEEGIDVQASRELIDAKKARFKQMRQISRELGTLVTKPKALCLHGILVELGDGLVWKDQTHFRVERTGENVLMWCTHGDWEGTLHSDLRFEIHAPGGSKFQQTEEYDWEVNKAMYVAKVSSSVEDDFQDDIPF